VAVDPTRFDQLAARDMRAERGIGDDPLIVSLGHVIPLRDRLALIDALPTVLARQPCANVMIIGRIYYDAFAKRAAELGVSDAIIMTGPVPKDDVPSYFAAADVAHDLQGGGCGTASLEAMATGRATIATVTQTNFPGVTLRNWEDSILVMPSDPAELARALIRLLEDPHERETIAKRQRELIHGHFTMDVVTRQHLDAFDRILNNTAEMKVTMFLDDERSA
jgi:glycosyltransferase involved in cell wall biosynthesis